MRKGDKQLDGEFCWCGDCAIKKIAQKYYCYKHDKPKANKQTKGRFSGVSKSEHAYGMY